MLEKFVKTLSEIDNEENKNRLIIESIIEEESIDPTNSIELKLFDVKPEKPALDPEFEKVLVSMDIPADMPAQQKRDYITDMIDKSMGYDKPEPIIGAVPVVEEAGDVEVSPKRVITMSGSDYHELVNIISKYNEDTVNKTKNRAVLKKFIAGVLRSLPAAMEVSSSIKSSIDLMMSKFAANVALPETADPKAAISAKLNAINRSI